MGTSVRDHPDEEDISALPIDRGWAWVVCAASCGIFLLVAGVYKSQGIVLVELRENYPEASATSLLWVINGCNLICRLSGPFGSYMLSRITHRSGLIIGMLMVSVSFCVLGYLPSVEYMYPFYSLLQGFGAGLTTLTCYSATSPYFRKRKGLALAITSSGGGGGAVVIPFILRFLLDNYNLSSAMVLFGGVNLHALIMAMLMRPIGFYEKLSSAKLKSETVKSLSSQKISTEVDDKLCVNKDCSDTDKPSVNLLFNSTSDIAGSLSVLSNIIVDENEEPAKRPKQERSSFNWRIITLPAFILIAAVGFFFECGLIVTFGCIPPLGKANNVSKELIATFLTAGGALEIPCRVLNGYLADKRLISISTQLSICLFASGMGALLCGLISGLAGVVIMITTLSAFSTSIFSLIPLIISELLGRDNLTSALGIVWGIQGLSIIIATFIAGGIYEKTQRWENVFLYSSGCLMFASLICSLYSFHNFRKRSVHHSHEAEIGGDKP